MKARIIGGGFVASNGFGTLNAGQAPRLQAGKPQIPKGKEIFQTPLARYGRFDRYTKLGCAGIALAARDANLDQAQEKRPVGIVLSTRYECYASDMEYYQTTLEQDGAFASPNLFSYTLPGIVLGEMAIHFKMTGPTLITGESGQARFGLTALDCALDLLTMQKCDTILAGWLDSPPQEIAGPDSRHGSCFVALSSAESSDEAKYIYKENKVIKSENGREITSVLDLF